MPNGIATLDKSGSFLNMYLPYNPESTPNLP